jgi:oxygen-independent coproporphyrinogen-3 oxidase
MMRDLGIYVHIPFCKKKCNYCDFISFSCFEDKYDEYFEKLKKEIIDRSVDNRGITTIYFGGGTPSFPDSKYIVDILNTIRENYNVKQDCEITIEINPGTVNKEKLLDYKNAGFNRLSIGIQSTHNRLLKLIGRIHSFDDFLKTYNLAKDTGFENINVDLMFALPTQTKDELIQSVNEVIELNPNHISLYSLILEENTKLFEQIQNKELELCDEELERKMYWITKELLESKGYNHYEISNFSKSGFESKHNLACWNQEEYLGFGLAAHSYLNNKRFSNSEKFEDYITNNKITEHEIQDDLAKRKEFMLLGFRKINGVSISEFERRFRINPLFYFRFEISKLVDEDLIEVDLDNIKLTNKGLDLANKVFEEFV